MPTLPFLCIFVCNCQFCLFKCRLQIWNIEGRKGIPKNLSPQVLGEVRVNFLGWIPTKPFVLWRSELFRKFLGRLRMILCYWKTFGVLNKEKKIEFPAVSCPLKHAVVRALKIWWYACGMPWREEEVWAGFMPLCPRAWILAFRVFSLLFWGAKPRKRSRTSMSEGCFANFVPGFTELPGQGWQFYLQYYITESPKIFHAMLEELWLLTEMSISRNFPK